MGIFKKIGSFFSGLFGRKQPPKKDDWLETYNKNAANPKNPTPLDPSNPWIT